MIKKIVLLLFVFTLTISCCLNIYAEGQEHHIVTVNNIDVIFSSTSSLTHEEKQLFAEYLVKGTPNVQTYGLICNVFGHKESTEIITTVTHCVRSTVPRCLEENWELIICTRCETIIEETRFGYLYIDCCPVD